MAWSRPPSALASGKPAQGKLTLSACHEAGSILIRITDDGRGIQRDKVLARAWERGLVERGVTPPDAEIFQLIFEPGFSTAEKVTNLSGRGVGMDVVRRNIEALRGSVNIHSVPGQGSTIEIRLPLTLAIIDGFLVGVGNSRFILPLDAVVEVIENRPTTGSVDARGRACVELRGQVLPVVSLRALYALESPEPERSSVVVIQAGVQRFGVRGGPAARPAPDRHQAAGPHVPQPAGHVRLFHPRQRRRRADLRRVFPQPTGR